MKRADEAVRINGGEQTFNIDSKGGGGLFLAWNGV